MYFPISYCAVFFLSFVRALFVFVDVKFFSFIIFLNQLSIILFIISLAIPKFLVVI